MKTDTKKNIVKLLGKRDYSVKELVEEIGFSAQVIHRHLKDLLDKNEIEKRGRAPKVFYRALSQEVDNTHSTAFTAEQEELLDKYFMEIDSSGVRTNGTKAFISWCIKRNYVPQERIIEYMQIVNKYEQQRDRIGLLPASKKLINSFGTDGPVNMWYVDLYSYETFGKTKLGQLVLYGKQHPTKEMVNEITNMVQKPIERLIKNESVNAIAYVAPTVKRKVQLMHVMKKSLGITLPEIAVTKIIMDVAVPQKTLKSKQDRQINARNTFVVEKPRTSYGTVLLIDDAVGSGASFYEIGRKMRTSGIAHKVICVSFVGSANEFPVINEA